MISIICVIGKNKAIGRNNQLIWDLPADLKHFKEITSGHPIIMGRKTFESIGRPLPNRTNIIITKNPEIKIEGCLVVHSLEAAIVNANKIDSQEIFIIGGGEIFRQAITQTDKLYLTVVDNSPDNADVFFPDYAEFKNISKEEARSENGFKFKFIELTRWKLSITK